MELTPPQIEDHLKRLDPEEVTEDDASRYLEVIDTELTPEQEERIRRPAMVFPGQRCLLAVHWHPEFVPMQLVSERIQATFPDAQERLIIPTQHNILLDYGGYSGVEVDCYSKAFDQKVQLLLHFASHRVEQAPVLRAMLAHTFSYRSSQLFDFIHTLVHPNQDRLERAVRATGADEDLLRFVQGHARKVQKMLDRYYEQTPKEVIKNKILRNYFDALRPEYGDRLIGRAQTLLKAVKAEVKANFPLVYFYRTSEVIEEARSLGGKIVIPHPEQFWPILLARYDVDGLEVWNPQSRRYTKFLISVLNRDNQALAAKRQLLIFMGDDTHMGEKTRPVEQQDKEKADREIGVQPAWDDLSINKDLVKAGISRGSVIAAYKQRLDG
jgi:hypothetical protein